MNKTLFTVLILMVLGVIGANYYTFFYTKNYSFLLEAPCDPKTHTCFVRDCESGACPPNNLSLYRKFEVKARDFDTCKTDSCLAECEIGAINCKETICGISPDDSCSNSGK